MVRLTKLKWKPNQKFKESENVQAEEEEEEEHEQVFDVMTNDEMELN